MRILMINDYEKKYGGAENIICTLKDKFEKNGHRVKILGAKEGENFRSYFSRFYSFYWYSKTMKEIKKFNPDIVHIHNCSRVISVSPANAAKRHGVPVVFSLHDFNYFNRRGKILQRVLRKIKSVIHKSVLFDAGVTIIVPSQFLANAVEKGITGKVRVIPHGIIMPTKFSDYKKKILFVGRLSPEKGLHTVVEVLNLVKGYDVEILGEGNQKKFLQLKYKNLKFKGFQNPDRYYQNTSITIAPSIVEESFGLSVAEAMSYGICVIASNMGALPELVRHMKTGLLFEPGNEKDFKEKLDYLMKNPKEIKRMGKNSREFVKKNFNWKNIVKQYEEVYRDAIREFKKK